MSVSTSTSRRLAFVNLASRVANWPSIFLPSTLGCSAATMLCSSSRMALTVLGFIQNCSIVSTT